MRLSFNTTHELGVFAFLSLFGLIIWLHPNPLPDFSIYAQRGAATRIWHETVPPVPEEIKALEERLQRDLEKLERDGREKAGVGLKEQMPWNKEIWQSWKNEELGEWRDTWKNHNPDWKYRLVLDSQADTLIRSTYAQVPDVLEIWNALKRPVLKADLFRYLVIYAYGGAVPALLIGHQKYGLIEVGWSGLYTDVDTTSIIPLDQWMTEEQWEDPNTHSVIALSAVGFAGQYTLPYVRRSRH